MSDDIIKEQVEPKEYKKGDKQNIAYNFIRNAIMTNQYEPNYPLIEKELSETLSGMSRTPIRDALMRLEHEGLAERIPGKGLFVAQVSMTDIIEITEMRLPLEKTAIQLFIERADQSARGNLKGIVEKHKMYFETGEYLKAVECDNEFHYEIARGSMNVRLYNTICKLIEDSSRGAFMTKHDSERIEKSIGQHQAIIKYIDANDVEQAVEQLMEHINSWSDYVKEIQFKNYYLLKYHNLNTKLL